ncbi:uncharacterized protein BO97DRAFT_402736 [Aspergillus homomorphus CBS 101889]|uniref:Uncharacterized protein n=1 Tax=Aspergillus homomorphus (strain CBS 101889) TaxID=1450537 RepID=A0A395IDR7_ASPHC|nr:hypothetical protein BO97DRAFT_402736 [Aspergillus homomorphus CBS 101889]RAL16304.1 hypothetical protein BO97DRAFT_402736 [Aspergillus homomorphus CBS 101889]
MLDESLPTFYLKPSRQTPHQSTIHLYQHGNDPHPTYTLRHPDPTPTNKNLYAAALYDAHVPSILYGEVLIRPQWPTPTLSAEAIRANGADHAPDPDPLLPTTFTINLYNPDQTVLVHYRPKTWNSPAAWEFEMPQHSFRQPSASTLDRTQADPASAEITPRLKFAWRRESKLSKDLTCFLSGKTTHLPEHRANKARTKEPDITVAMFQALKELTLYEPNLYRVEMEDFKGLEVVLLLAAVTIRDVWFASQGLREVFRVGKVGGGAVSSAGNGGGNGSGNAGKQRPAGGSSSGLAIPSGAPNSSSPSSPSSLSPIRQSPPRSRPAQSQTSPTESWRKQEEERRTQMLLEEEEQARRRREAERQAEIDRETLRLQQIYGQEEERVRMQAAVPLPPRTTATPAPAPSLPLRPANPQQHHTYPNQGGRPRIQSPGAADPRQSVVRFSLSPEQQQQQQQAKPSLQPKKSSFFRLRRSSADETKLGKKRSSMF